MFYNKMKGDYYRYITEVNTDDKANDGTYVSLTFICCLAPHFLRDSAFVDKTKKF